jgi:type IV secretory pathway TrbL component
MTGGLFGHDRTPRVTRFSRAANVLFALAILTVVGHAVRRSWLTHGDRGKAALKAADASAARDAGQMASAINSALVVASATPPSSPVDASAGAGLVASVDASAAPVDAGARSDAAKNDMHIPAHPVAPPRPKPGPKPKTGPRSKDDDIGF